MKTMVFMKFVILMTELDSAISGIWWVITPPLSYNPPWFWQCRLIRGGYNSPNTTDRSEVTWHAAIQRATYDAGCYDPESCDPIRSRGWVLTMECPGCQSCSDQTCRRNYMAKIYPSRRIAHLERPTFLYQNDKKCATGELENFVLSKTGTPSCEIFPLVTSSSKIRFWS